MWYIWLQFSCAISDKTINGKQFEEIAWVGVILWLTNIGKQTCILLLGGYYTTYF